MKIDLSNQRLKFLQIMINDYNICSLNIKKKILIASKINICQSIVRFLMSSTKLIETYHNHNNENIYLIWLTFLVELIFHF
jgi:hypothetical protein